MTNSNLKKTNPRTQKKTGSRSVSQNKALLALGAVTLLLYVAINVLAGISGALYFDIANSIVVLPLVIGIVIVTFGLRNKMEKGSDNHALWTGMAIGATSWAIAELWWAIGVITGSEIPYPSGADFFWLAAYIPMTRAIWIRIRSLPKNTDRLWKAAMWALSLLIVAFTVVFVLVPLIQDYDPDLLLESLLNLLYPLGDLVLLLLTLWILSAYQQGRYGQAWVWIAGGFFLTAFSDLLFTYSSMAGTYYPDGQANLISVLLVDVPYTLGYLGWLVGMLLLRNLLAQHQPLTVEAQTFTLVPDTHLFLATKGDDTIIDVSRNVPQVFPMNAHWNGQLLWQVLGMPEESCAAMLDALKERDVLQERAITVNTCAGLKEARFSGFAIRDPQGEYNGASLLVRMLFQDDTYDSLLTDEQVSMIRYIGKKTGVLADEEAAIKRLLTHYYLMHIKALYNRSFAEGGAFMADTFTAELLDAVRRHAWQIKPHPANLLDVSVLSLAELKIALPALLDAAKQFIARITDDVTADSVVLEVRDQIDGAVHQHVKRFVTEM